MEITQWLSLGQTARRLGVSSQMVDTYCKTNKLAFVMTPLGRLIDPASVERLAQVRAALRAAAERLRQEKAAEVRRADQS